MRKVSSAEAINSIDSLLLYLQQEELNIELQTLSKLRKSVFGNKEDMIILCLIIKSTIFIGYSY